MLQLLSTRDSRTFLAGLPDRRLVPLGLAVFAMFAVMGFVIDIMAGGRHPAELLAANVIFSGAIGVAYGYTSLRSIRFAVVAGIVHFAYAMLAPRLFGPLDEGPPRMDRLRFDAIAIIVCITLSYTFFLRFIGTTGIRYLSARAEIRLASEIHAVLVPVIETTVGEFDVYGLSRASGDVGGDLVDLVRTAEGGGWIGYVADVSGHGVSSGVLMGMTKSAARMRLRDEASLAELVQALDDVLQSLKRPSMFVTFAGVRPVSDGGLEFTVAGHLPILTVSPAGTVREWTTPQIPIGMFEGHRFVAGTLHCGPGELIAIVTDGLTEVFDRRDREYGFDRLKAFLAAHAGQPLPQIARGLLEDVGRHGPQIDDQTLLLIRRNRRAVKP